MLNRLLKISLITLIWLGLALPNFPLNLAGNQIQAEEITGEPGFLGESSMPGRVEGTGTYFGIEDSEYLNITLKSSEEIKVILESIPRMISIIVEPASNEINLANLTIEGLEPNKPYYKYQDSYKSQVVFISDENGSYTWTQNLSQFHHIWFQETRGTIYIPDDCTAPYGIWNTITSTCTLNQNLTESVEITANNITIDCDAHSISGPGFSGYGIYLNTRTGITIRNCSIGNFFSNIYLVNSSNNYLTNNILVGTWTGISLVSSFNNTVIYNNISDHLSFGISLSGSDNKIYHNNLIRNGLLNAPPCPGCGTQAVVYSGLNNQFDNGYPSGGNYWSDYQGIDEKSGKNQDQPGSDGIGDTPYTFLGGQDRYPFMRESGWEAPLVPTYNVAVILAETADIPHTFSSITAQPCKLIPEKTYPNGYSKEYYQDLAYCVVDYHKENSFGRINLNFAIYDNEGQWFKISKNAADYVGREQEFVIDAINLAVESGVNLFNRDIVIVVHSGKAAKTKKDVGKRLITMTWALISQPLGYPPYKIIVAEDDLVGAWVHEIGHIIGALLTPQNTIIPDLSRMGLTTKWPEILDPTKAGNWDVMAEGSRNESGNNPPYMSSYTKEFLQWLNYDIYPKSAYGEYWINSLTTSNYGDSVVRYNLCDNTNEDCPEYYILEVRNRNLKTWDSSLPKEKALVLYKVNRRSYSKYGYDENGLMWNQYWTITIPASAHDNIFGFNDGILSPTGEIYQDLDNLVKFIARSEKNINGKYGIQTEIEKITQDSFRDKFWGVILKPSAIFEQKTNTTPIILNPIKISEIQNPLRGPTTIKEIVEGIGKIFLWLLSIPLILLSILSLLLDKTIISRWKSEKGKKTIKIIFKIIWIITLISIAVSIFSLILVPILERIEPPPPSPRPGELWNPLLGATSPDLDLHLYCDDGRHIGMNYETGDYDVQIQEAIVSGNNQNAPEWIFIPPNITDCRFIVSSWSNQKFLEENLQIAQEIEDTTDSYDIYARYIDPATAIYTSSVISQDITPGVKLEHKISGTDDIAIGSGILIADVNFDPATLNLENKGEFVTVYIELPQGFNVSQIDISSLKLNGLVSAETNSKYGFVKNPEIEDRNGNGLPELMVKFDRNEVKRILEPEENIKIVLTGRIFHNSNYLDFEGQNIIRVIK